MCCLCESFIVCEVECLLCIYGWIFGLVDGYICVLVLGDFDVEYVMCGDILMFVEVIV